MFTLRLPVAESSVGPTAVPSDSTQASAQRLNLRVLVVDDNVDAADTLSMLVKIAGAEVQTAYAGEAGLRAGRTFQPDVVLLDVGMPGLDGYATCRQLRTEPWGQHALVVALTGWGQPADRERALAAGFDRHLTKPAEPATVTGLLAELRPPRTRP